MSVSCVCEAEARCHCYLTQPLVCLAGARLRSSVTHICSDDVLAMISACLKYNVVLPSDILDVHGVKTRSTILALHPAVAMLPLCRRACPHAALKSFLPAELLQGVLTRAVLPACGPWSELRASEAWNSQRYQ